MLAFGDESEDEEFQVQPEKHKHVRSKNVKKKKKKKKKKYAQAPVASSSYGPVLLGEARATEDYSKEGLLALQKNALHHTPASLAAVSVTAMAPSEPVEGQTILDPMDMESDEDAEQVQNRKRLAQQARQRRREHAVQTKARVKSATEIADEDADRDYIALRGGNSVRREDEKFTVRLDGETRVFTKATAAEERRGRVNDNSDDGGVDHFEQSHAQRLHMGRSAQEPAVWERKHGGKHRASTLPADVDLRALVADSASSDSDITMTDQTSQQKQQQQEVDAELERYQRCLESKPLPGEPILQQQTTMEQFLGSLDVTIQDTKSNLEYSAKDSQNITRAIEEAKLMMSSAQSRLTTLNDEYICFQSVLYDVQDLLDCLHEKADITENAMAEYLDMYVRHGQAREATVLLHLRDLSVDANDQRSASPVELDDFGREKPSTNVVMRRARAEQRLKRSQERKQAIGEESGKPGDLVFEALLSDDEPFAEEEEELKRHAEETTFRADVEDIFSDVTSNFASLAYILEQFLVLKTSYPAQYEQAFIQTALPVLLAPHIRVELMLWDVWQTAWEDLPFVTQLQGFDQTTAAPDKKVLPRVVRNLVVPLVRNVLAHRWNPLSVSMAQSAFVQSLVALSKLLPAEFTAWNTVMKQRLMQLRTTLNHNASDALFPCLTRAAKIARACWTWETVWGDGSFALTVSTVKTLLPALLELTKKQGESQTVVQTRFREMISARRDTALRVTLNSINPT